ncbi:MAG: SDR family oxidoreductase, partial [Deltaproteobacteria bacterium]|nr:SDR family oxidoreductase [Deltaproteobacteria bacterium]
LAAVNFVQAASGSALERIIYLGGLGGDRPDSSPHLKSRLEVAQILACGTVPVTSLFAAMILGSGSTSFEIMRYLVERLPVMIVPSSVINSRIQPISIKNVINYLAGCLENKETMGRSFDIGGPDVITYRELLEIYAIEKGVRRPLIISPRIIANSSIATRFVFFIARHVLPVPPSISHPLLEGAKNEAIVRENSVRELIPQRLIPCGEAIGWAIKRDSQQIVKTRWTDAGVIKPPEWAQRGDAPYAGGTLLQGGFRIWLKALPEEIWPVIRKMGGNNGYYYGDILWQIRGWMDSMAGGAGLRRGRRDPEYIRVGDALDFWRVLDVDAPERLILLAEMKLPGEAILDISIIRHGNRSELRFGTRFRPKGLYGIFYWYLLKPAHDLLFRGMLRAIAKKIDCQVLKGPEKFKPGPIW